ncbi:TonB-dependent receptor [Rhodohalobacter sp. SW132]|uniref:TonB-dependent receptor n=1 Tax=Rhodohalobacter sp. SW132 TaxID=2293433 RepID=UPI000E220DEC|nr:TonB-dependent receptor [Rhodohalobacter sp. SW132]REL24780.1 TonB-dependent receptor [Rhodohalobacter sp. SW132]
MRQTLLLFSLLFIFGSAGYAQSGTIAGTVIDRDTGEPLFGVNILVRGTNFGAVTNFDGEYQIRNIRPGEYNLEFRYVGYERTLVTEIRVEEGEETELNVELGQQAISADDEVIVVGERPIFDVEQSSTGSTFSREQIAAAPISRVEEVVGMTAGVVRDPTGLYIRGGRANETGYIVDGVSAQDPLAGTGFGLDLGSNAFSSVDVTTGGMDVEHGNATSGVVSVQTQDGGDDYAGNFSHMRDNFGSMTDNPANFFTDTFEFNLGGPEPITSDLLPALGLNIPGNLYFFMTGQASMTNEFMRRTADQVQTSMIDNDFWSPRQDNRWNGMFKLTYRMRPGMRLEGAYQRSLTINQNTRMLQIVGDDVQIRPGHQFFFQNNLDNANTYAHDSKLAYLKWTHALSSNTLYDVQVSRLFTRLRADANGRNWRPDAVDGEFDARSIVVYPIEPFPAGDNFSYVLPGPGFANNGGIATLWHDHYAEEYTVRTNLTRYLLDETHRLRFGAEFKFMEYQWIDITRPWVGAPIQIDEDTFSETNRLGASSDIWNVSPSRGAFYVSDRIRYLGLIANVGMRLEYWFPGSYVDNFVDDPLSPIPNSIREDYKNDTYNFFGNRFKMRLLPRINVSFPVRENMVMYFNYSHKSKLPHPSYVYAGLDPFYQDRSFLSDLGNPNLDPEVDISYEIGFRYQLTSNDALNITAFWSDKYDFITAERIIVRDATGRDTERSFRVNGDFARVRGLEASYLKRYSHFLSGSINATYSRAEGLSSTSNDALSDLISGGQDIGNNVETPLAWDRPIDIKSSLIFRWDRPNNPLFGLSPLNQMQLYLSGSYRSGIRYTPMEFRGNQRNPVTGAEDWRPIYERSDDPSERFSAVGEPWIMFDMNFLKWFEVGNTRITAKLEITNLLNNSNAAIINPVTGQAYRTDYPSSQEDLIALRNDRSFDVPANVRDPRYVDPRDNNSPAYLNPANFLEQRHVMFGLEINF